MAKAWPWWKNAKTGDQLYDKADPRHVGTIERIYWSTMARVRWNETGWLSDDVYLPDCIKVAPERSAA